MYSYQPIILLLLSVHLIRALSTSIGINYGQVADNLISPGKVLHLLQPTGVRKLKLYKPDADVLRAFANSGVEFSVGLPDECLVEVRDPAKASAWIRNNVQSYFPATNITMISVGNEILTSNVTSLRQHLLPAMQSIRSALVGLGLDKQVKVTTTHSLSVLQSSYPPSSGRFREDLKSNISLILDFLSERDSYFWINAYPYFAYKGNPASVSLDFALLQSNQGLVDPLTNLRYDNMLEAQVDAVYAALGVLGYGNMQVQVSETGWPSKGDSGEAGASVVNARTYTRNLVKLVSRKKGTPMRVNTSLDVYVFALFNEDKKPGPTSERNYGLFRPDGTPAYELPFNTGIVTSGTGITPTGSPTILMSDGYMNVSSAPGGRWQLLQLFCMILISSSICQLLL